MVNENSSKVRLKDIAEEVGTTPGTVSRVLNGRMLDRISDRTQAKVRSAAHRLGYSVNPIARAMRTNETMTLGVSVRGLREPARAGLAEELEYQCQQRGYDLFIGIERDEPLAELQRLRNRMIDGLILIRGAFISDPNGVIEQLAEESFPLVCMGPQPRRDVASVDWQRRGGTRELAEGLFRRGAERAMLIGRESSPGMIQRADGLEDACRNIGRELKSEVCILGKSNNVTEKITNELRRFLPDTVIVQSEKLALSVFHATKVLGWKIPEELWLACASSAQLAEWQAPPLTTLDPDQEQLAQKALEILIAQIHKQPGEPNRKVHRVPAEIHWRASTGIVS